MLFNEFKDRCYKEFNYKNPKAATTSISIGIIGSAAIFMIDFMIIKQGSNIESAIFSLIKASIIASIIRAIYERIVYALPRDVLKQAKRDKSYMNYPIDYPYSLIYPGEPFPFDRKDVPPVNTDATSAPAASPTSAPAASPTSAPAASPTPAPVRESTPAPAQPEQVTITCGECGQPMLIPSNSGTVKITCPKCGNSFIHTN